MKELKKELRVQSRRVYGIAFLAAAGFNQLVWLLYDLFTAPWYAVLMLLTLAVISAGIIILCRKVATEERAWAAEDCGEEAVWYFRTMSERYAKRTINGTALFFAACSFFLAAEVIFAFQGNSKPAEIAENIFANMLVIQAPFFLCVKNLLLSGVLRKRCGYPEKGIFQRHLKGVALFSGVYWLAVLLTVYLFIDHISRPVNVMLVTGVFFAGLILLYNLKLRKKFITANIVINRRRIAVFLLMAVCISGYQFLTRDTWYTQTYINSIPIVGDHGDPVVYDERTGVYTITSSTDDFRILHLTDIHLGGSLYSYQKDMKALRACYAEIEHTKPDLVVVTGDLTFPMGIMSLSLNNSAPVGQFAAFMRNIGIPWCFTYGNHDTEGMAVMSKSDLNDLYKSLSFKTSGTLLYPYVQPAITGRNNQLIKVRNSDGTLNTALFLIDSNSYTGEGINVYDYIHDDQVDWYAEEVKRMNREEGHTVNSMVFFHIPLKEYRTAYELYEEGSSEVTYFFGENGEKMIDKVCCSDYPSSLFDRMVELGSTKAVFCGHDHYNNMSLEYKGIRLTYGMSIDYLAMPGIEDDTEQRGAELITLHRNGSWDLRQIPLVEIE